MIDRPYTERVAQFGPGRGLVGIVTIPEQRPAVDLPAVVLLNAGLLHRVGPNRVYVEIARALAGAGFTVLRFDFSGMGDSHPRADHLPYAQSAPSEAQDAMDWLAEMQGASSFVCMGHCAGAAFSLLLASTDPRVAGAALINMEGGDEQWTEYDRMKKVSQQYARYYGKVALFSRERWARLLRGQVDFRSITRNILKDTIWYRLKGLFFQSNQAFQNRTKSVQVAQEENARQYLQPLAERGTPLLLVHSEGSTGLAKIRANFGPALGRLEAAGLLELRIIAQCDHMFTLVDRQRRLSETLTGWALARFGNATGTPQLAEASVRERPQATIAA